MQDEIDDLLLRIVAYSGRLSKPLLGGYALTLGISEQETLRRLQCFVDSELVTVTKKEGGLLELKMQTLSCKLGNSIGGIDLDLLQAEKMQTLSSYTKNFMGNFTDKMQTLSYYIGNSIGNNDLQTLEKVLLFYYIYYIILFFSTNKEKYYTNKEKIDLLKDIKNASANQSLVTKVIGMVPAHRGRQRLHTLTDSEIEFLDWFEGKLRASSTYLRPRWRAEQLRDTIGIFKIASLPEWQSCYEFAKTDSWWRTKVMVKVSTLKNVWNSYIASRSLGHGSHKTNRPAVKRKTRSAIEDEIIGDGSDT